MEREQGEMYRAWKKKPYMKNRRAKKLLIMRGTIALLFSSSFVACDGNGWAMDLPLERGVEAGVGH